VSKIFGEVDNKGNYQMLLTKVTRVLPKGVGLNLEKWEDKH